MSGQTPTPGNVPDSNQQPALDSAPPPTSGQSPGQESASGQIPAPGQVPTPGQSLNNSDEEHALIPPSRLNELDLKDCAVEIKNLNFSYNKVRKGKKYLLDKFSLTFPRGAIYGFLGPSGCGKTTLTKLIVGLLKPKSGTIKINGRRMNDARNHLPGPGVGYMPQDTALFEEFSIYETLKYFSNLYGMPEQYRDKRIDNLIKFLDLPDKHRRVAVLSGGQKRRTSLAVAIIHSPPLLILDEPTVGIDPVLRERIWQHMLELSSKENISIMITTHYIEECRRAHVIGLMRNGRLLTENSPNALLTYFNTDNLENVFLQTCQAEEGKSMDKLPPTLAQAQQNQGQHNVVKPKSVIHFHASRLQRFYCLFKKNVTILSRDLVLVFLEILLPMVGIFLFSLAVGNKPHGLHVALYSEERLNTSLKVRLSEILLEEIEKDKEVILFKDYNSGEAADQSVELGETSGALHVDLNFSVALTDKMQFVLQLAKEIPESVTKQSTIVFNGDLSDISLYQTFLMEFYEGMLRFMMKLLESKFKGAGQAMNGTAMPNVTGTMTAPNMKVLSPIVQFVDPPIYGSKDINFRDFTHASFLLITVFFLPLAMTGLTMIQERMKGLLDRSLVAGAKLPEILAALIMVQAIVLLLQIGGILVITLVIFDFYNEGNIGIIFVSALLQGICGICVGVAISMTFNDMLVAIGMVAGIFIPNQIISGALWPTEAMYPWLRYCSYTLPQTIPIKSLRAVILKGWGIDHFYVWLGMIISIFWSILFFIYSVLIGTIKG